MATKNQVVTAATKKWRKDNGLVGKQLTKDQRSALNLHTKTAWKEHEKETRDQTSPVTMPGATKSPDVPTLPEDEKPLEMPAGIPLTADLETLGTRKRVRSVVKRVKVGEGDHGDIMAHREVEEHYTVNSSLLTVEEALTLGTQLWYSMENKAEQFTCRVQYGDRGMQSRRFIIGREDFEKLCAL